MKNMIKYKSLLPMFVVTSLRKFWYFIEIEKKHNDHNLSAKKKIWSWKNGFASGHYKLYKLDKKNINKYLSPKEYLKMHPFNGKYSTLLDNKAFLPLIISNTTKLYIVYENGVLRYCKGLNTQNIENNLMKHSSELVVKPSCGEGGEGVETLTTEYELSIIQENIIRKRSFIIQEHLKQLPYANEIFSETLNTIRVVLFRDCDTKKIEILGAVHRFGTNESIPVDNAGKGGMIANIDNSTGELGEAFVYQNKKYSGYHKLHPNTKQPIFGKIIPNWLEMKNKLVEMFNDIYWFEYGGIDVVLTEDGFIVLEINSLPDLELIQIFKPVLEDKKFNKFLKSRGF